MTTQFIAPPEQTNKALELGAPILRVGQITNTCTNYCKLFKRTSIDNIGYHTPTTEQMIGWLEQQISFIDVIRQENDTWLYIIYPETHSNKNITVKGFSSRKGATLAAIDAALDYLIDN